MTNQKLLLKDFEPQVLSQKHPKQKRMSRSYCPCCGLANCFIVDYDWGKPIYICIKCSKREEFKIDYSMTAHCKKCGETFIPIKSATCPVCWIKWFREQEKQ